MGGKSRQGEVDTLLDKLQHVALAPISGGSTIPLILLIEQKDREGDVNALNTTTTPKRSPEEQ